MDLDSLKYADLRQLAKSVGLKANMKAEKLLKALKEHFEQQGSSENGNSVVADVVQTPAGVDEAKPSHVTKRRGKAQGAKRKHSDQGCTDNDPKLGDSPAQDSAMPDEAQDGRRSSKRRKVSPAKGTETPASSEEPKGNQPGAQPESDASTEQSAKGVGKKTAGKIPRHEGLLKKKALRPTTPDFKKLHEAHFNKMESIDSYVQRKNKQMEAFRNTVKELKAQSENVKKSGDAKTRAKPLVSRASLFSPGVQERKPSAEKHRFTQILAKKSAVKDSAPFRPTVLSTNKINVRFTQGTQDNEHKRSLVKTPARMSPMIPLTPTPGRKSEVLTKPETNKTPGLTPFVFSGASTTPATNKKNTFDLKASLSRPLTYKPHKGKLKPFGATQDANASLNKSQTVPSHQKNYKQQVQTRDERRIKHTEDRKQKKEKMLGARRGLVMA
ncbi:LOW QUALITY PROTEIN: nucleolar and spindle-associated protein 1 [Colossoma macropomum]|uniref:LOW QUALITY PROTEIN: nucleolar and spindle-associated protein 1 n=1 Tax=Colossoma macropomum TaxID=42526 RepID=UPI0018647620|nr:LOW QUALITY PROTEIN: nucleolar and spindle-associated protein 1 [Colossoma macropomum]